MTPLLTGATIGILGGGQLGRMLALAAARLGFDVHIFAPEADGPAERVAARATNAPFDDLDAIARFAGACDVVTYEFENVPLASAEEAAKHAPLRPGLKALRISQDRVLEKEFANGIGAETVMFAALDGPDDCAAALRRTRAPAILKTRRDGYDGKGQIALPRETLHEPERLIAALETLNGAPAILESRAPFKREVSIVAARGQDGDRVFYDLSQNRHDDGVLRDARAPADLKPDVEVRAMDIAAVFLRELEYVGVLAIEFFELEGGRLLLNEFAPRVHNSGHWTMDACPCDQFEMHIRAITGWPLGDARRTHDVVMTNLFGEEVLEAAQLAEQEGVHVHVYAKHPLREGRKTGHINRVKR